MSYATYLLYVTGEDKITCKLELYKDCLLFSDRTPGQKQPARILCIYGSVLVAHSKYLLSFTK